jgi:hypothetical protein
LLHLHLDRVRRTPEAQIDHHRIDASLTYLRRERRPPHSTAEEQPTAQRGGITRENYGYSAGLRPKNETEGKSHPDARTVADPRSESVNVAVAVKRSREN